MAKCKGNDCPWTLMLITTILGIVVAAGIALSAYLKSINTVVTETKTKQETIEKTISADKIALNRTLIRMADKQDKTFTRIANKQDKILESVSNIEGRLGIKKNVSSLASIIKVVECGDELKNIASGARQ